MLYLVVLGVAFLLAAAAYCWGHRASKDKWELLRAMSDGKIGLYKHRRYVRLGKMERVFSTYAVLRTAQPKRIWSYVWKMDRIAKGGRAIGLTEPLPTSGQKSLHEIGFAPPIGVYAVYTGEEDHLRYAEREKFVLDLYKKTAARHKEWREDKAYKVRRTLAQLKWPSIVFVVSACAAWFVPSDVEAPQVLVWTLIGTMAVGVLVATLCAASTQGRPLWLRACGGSLVMACALACVALPSAFMGINSVAFSTLCEGPMPVERFWASTSPRGESVHFADVTLPPSCQFNAHYTPIGAELYQEFQAGRRVVDVVVSRGLLGYKKILLIGA